MALVWALIPIANGILYGIPIAPLLDEGEKGLTMGELFKKKIFTGSDVNDALCRSQ